MARIFQGVQTKVKKSSEGVLLYSFRCFTGLLLGLTFALIGKEIIGYESLSFTLVSVVVIGVFLKISKSWGFMGVLVFNLVVLLLAMLLRMYILIAPGA